MLQSGHHPVDVVEEVGQDDDHAAFCEPLGQFVKDRAAGGLPLAVGAVHRLEQRLDVRGVAGRADEGADFMVERGQPDAVLLLEDHVGQGGGGPLCVVELRRSRPVAPICHALARVEQQMANQVRLLVETLHAKPVGPGHAFQSR